MPRVYKVRNVLEGTMYDATTMIQQGRVKDAYALLKQKIIEIEKMNNAAWCKTSWE